MGSGFAWHLHLPRRFQLSSRYGSEGVGSGSLIQLNFTYITFARWCIETRKRAQRIRPLLIRHHIAVFEYTFKYYVLCFIHQIRIIWRSFSDEKCATRVCVNACHVCLCEMMMIKLNDKQREQKIDFNRWTFFLLSSFDVFDTTRRRRRRRRKIGEFPNFHFGFISFNLPLAKKTPTNTAAPNNSMALVTFIPHEESAWKMCLQIKFSMKIEASLHDEANFPPPNPRIDGFRWKKFCSGCSFSDEKSSWLIEILT